MTAAFVKTEEVDGSHLENMIDIIADQSEMDQIMIDLRIKVNEMCRQFEKEL